MNGISLGTELPGVESRYTNDDANENTLIILEDFHLLETRKVLQEVDIRGQLDNNAPV